MSGRNPDISISARNPSEEGLYLSLKFTQYDWQMPNERAAQVRATALSAVTNYGYGTLRDHTSSDFAGWTVVIAGDTPQEKYANMQGLLGEIMRNHRGRDHEELRVHVDSSLHSDLGLAPPVETVAAGAGTRLPPSEIASPARQ